MKATDIKHTIDRISVATGHKHSTICQRVLGNPKYYERLVNRINDDAKKGRKFSDYLEKVESEGSQGVRFTDHLSTP